ncbi:MULTISPECIES: pilus assembly protein [Methanobacterium]|uniref:Pilus assembly protein n=1 Tax=Methanobacterium bryantii TaxID=2161 RepID=A0A2A2H1D4_METBR|nr:MULTISPECIES: pilus assembly protein [Methanobacterium]OEC84271.1 pilus assembly protein [Methanobacterium sp. A39]PAV03231.1 pilus assembly protein [Methanobacterium bryantii]
MTTCSTNINVYVSKIKMVRPKKNPKNSNFDLNLDWNIDYVKTDEKTLKYVCTVSAVGKMPLNFEIHGLIKFEDKNTNLESISEELSALIIDKSINTMNNMLNETKDIKILINTTNNAHTTEISEIVLKGWC